MVVVQYSGECVKNGYQCQYQVQIGEDIFIYVCVCQVIGQGVEYCIVYFVFGKVIVGVECNV